MGGAAPGPLPLMPQELERLQAGLVENMEAAGCMSLDIAHGFFTATAAQHPDRPGTLIDRVLGALQNDTALRELLTRFHAQVLRDLDAADYGPLVLQMPRDDGSPLPLPYGWCQGYVTGLEFLGEDRRDRLITDERAGALLAPILSFLMYREDQWFDPPNETAHREAVEELGGVAVALYQWWRERLDN